MRIFNNGDMTLELQKKIVPLLEKESDAIAKKLLNNKKSFLLKLLIGYLEEMDGLMILDLVV